MNYSVYEKECFAVLWVLETIQSSVMYENFFAYMERAAFYWLLVIHDPSGPLFR